MTASHRLRVVFMGTPEFAVPSLRALVEHPCVDIVGVVTRPDAPQGRRLMLTASPVKRFAGEYHIPVHQPSKINTSESIDMIRGMKPDLIVTAAFGGFLGKTLLDLPRLGCINIHASLLPKYRGAAPIHYAIKCGESVTGISIFRLVEEMDAGDLMLQERLAIYEEETTGQLHDRLSILGAEAIQEVVTLLNEGTVMHTPQDHAKASYAPKLKKEDGLIPWHSPARTVYNHIRAMTPWPGAFTYWNGRMIKVSESFWGADTSGKPPGRAEVLGKDGLRVACQEGWVGLKTIQLGGRRSMSIEEFLRGHAPLDNALFGEMRTC